MDLDAFFDGIHSAQVSGFISSRREEDLFLDFKTVNRSDLSHSDDKKTFAKALSGFANSSGGIIVWGVEARKDAVTDADCATSLREIDDVALFVSRLNEFTGQFVRPLVDGVRHRGITLSGTSGVALSYVPPSDAGPHMALAAEARRNSAARGIRPLRPARRS